PGEQEPPGFVSARRDTAHADGHTRKWRSVKRERATGKSRLACRRLKGRQILPRGVSTVAAPVIERLRIRPPRPRIRRAKFDGCGVGDRFIRGLCTYDGSLRCRPAGCYRGSSAPIYDHRLVPAYTFVKRAGMYPHDVL